MIDHFSSVHVGFGFSGNNKKVGRTSKYWKFTMAFDNCRKGLRSQYSAFSWYIYRLAVEKTLNLYKNGLLSIHSSHKKLFRAIITHNRTLLMQNTHFDIDMSSDNTSESDITVNLNI